MNILDIKPCSKILINDCLCADVLWTHEDRLYFELGGLRNELGYIREDGTMHIFGWSFNSSAKAEITHIFEPNEIKKTSYETLKAYRRKQQLNKDLARIREFLSIWKRRVLTWISLERI